MCRKFARFCLVFLINREKTACFMRKNCWNLFAFSCKTARKEVCRQGKARKKSVNFRLRQPEIAAFWRKRLWNSALESKKFLKNAQKIQIYFENSIKNHIFKPLHLVFRLRLQCASRSACGENPAGGLCMLPQNAAGVCAVPGELFWSKTCRKSPEKSTFFERVLILLYN